jgi:hypothetical protein
MASELLKRYLTDVKDNENVTYKFFCNAELLFR